MIEIEKGFKVRDVSHEDKGVVIWISRDGQWFEVEWQGADKNEPVTYSTVHISTLDCREDWQF